MAGTSVVAPTPASKTTPAAKPAMPRTAPPPRVPGPASGISQMGLPAIRLQAAVPVATPSQTSGFAGGGEPLAGEVKTPIEESLGVSLESVRVHKDSRAQKTARGLSARAFTFARHIFLGRGERPTDLGLMAHEAAHVVQQQGAPAVQRLGPGQTDSWEEEAHRASSAVVRGEPFKVQERTSRPRVQRWGVSDVLDYFADKANIIPGFRMFTIVLGVNPINMSSVDRSAANILRAVVEFIPGGGLITQALDNYGIFEKAGKWVEQQIQTLGMVGSAIKAAVTSFIDSLSWKDIFNLGDVWDRAKRIFTDPIDKIIAFVKGLVLGFLGLIRDALLRPLAKLAEGTAGWDLLKAVLGQDPITGDPVPQTAEALIGGFMKLIGQEEIWNNIKKANALSRAWAWFKGALNGLLGFVKQVPSLIISTIKSIELMDIVLLPRVFIKIGTAFAGFLGKFFSWAGNTIWDLLKIIFEVVAPGAIPYLKKVGAAIKKIFKDPIGFVGNLVKAGKLGFQNFANNIGAHLKAAFLDWLTGSLPGVYIPKSFALMEILKLALSVLGLTWANIRQKLVKATSENVVKGLEVGFAIVKKLVTEGPAAAWEEIKSQLANLKDMVVEGIMSFIVETVVKKAVAKVLSLLVPGGAFIQAIISIYDTIMVFIAKLSKIIQVAMAFLDSMMAIANGAIGGAAAKVESVLAGLLSLAISFLAGFLGLGKIADKVMNIINTKVRAPVDKALDYLINWIVTTAKKLFAALFGKKEKPDERTDAQKKADLQKAMAEAAAVQATPNIAEDQIKAKLLPIKTKYKMVSLELVVSKKTEEQEFVHVEGVINPPGSTPEVPIKLKVDVGANVGQQVIVKMGDEWKLGAIDNIDQAAQIVWSKVTGARFGLPFAKFKTSYAGGYTVVRPFDPNAKGNGKYKHIADPPSVGPFKYFTATQKSNVIAENRKNNGGSLVSDMGGAVVLTTKRGRGAKVNPDEVNIDHIFPRSQGGWNSYANAQVLSFSQNLAKLDAIPDVF
jgi:Domain of unknown function (DUF4157)